jgi:AmmeMemoRadiSam system protein B
MYIRQPAHAGTFYPAHPQVLHQMIMDFSVAVKDLVDLDEIYNRLDLKRAAISPHAGYIYSGIVAAASWGILQKNKNIKKFIII